MSIFKKTLSIVLAAMMALSVFSVAVSAASDFTVDGEDPIATLTLSTPTLTVNPGDEIVVTANLTTNFYAASYTIAWWYSKNILSPVSAAPSEGSPYADYAKFAYNANLNTTLTKNQFGTKTLAWAENPVLAANGLTVNDITKDNFQNYFYYVTCGFTPNSQIGSQAAVMNNDAIVDYTFKVAEDAAPGTVGVIWFDQSYGWASNNTSGIHKIAAFKDGAGQVGTSTTACYTDLSTEGARLVFTVAGAAEPEAADYSAVEAAIAKVPADLANYTDDSVAALNAAIAAVNYDLTADDQATVDAFAAAIEAAIAGLTLKAADYTAVEAAIKSIPADLTSFTDESVAALQREVNGVVYGLDITKQAEVDAMAAAIIAAILNLEVAPLPDADYIKVEEAIASIPADLTIYTDDSVAAVNAAVDAVVYGLDITKQAEVDAFAAAIVAAVAGLEEKAADYTAVEEAIASIPADLSIYTDETVAALNAAVEAVVEGLKITAQAKVNAFAAAIVAAVADLELKAADYAAVEAAKANIPEDLTIYTDDSVAAVNAAVEAVVEGLDITKQAEVNAFAAAIETAVAGLTLKAADYAAVEAAKAKIPADLTIYTDESVAELQTVVDSVEYDLDITMQQVVDGYAAAIEAAIAALELKPVAPVESNVTNVAAVEGAYVVTVKGTPEKLQFIGDGTTRTYTRESDVVTITAGEDGTEIWTIAIVLPVADYEAIARYNKVWDEIGYEFAVAEVEEPTPELDEAFYSAEVAVDGIEATYTVKTGTDVAKIQIVDGDTIKTLSADYEDIDGVRVWTWTKTVRKGNHTVTVNFKTSEGWKTAEAAVEYTAAVKVAE